MTCSRLGGLLQTVVAFCEPWCPSGLEEALDSDSRNRQPRGAEISQGTSTLLRSPAVDAQALAPQTLAVTEGETLIA